jgi:hypothetical protein
MIEQPRYSGVLRKRLSVVDLFQRALRPVGAVLLQDISSGRWCGMRSGQRCRSSCPLSPKEFDRFLLLGVELGGVVVYGLLGGGTERGLLLHRVPDLGRDRHHVIGHEMAGQHKLGGHLVELHQPAGEDRVLLAVDGAGLQRGVDLGIGDGRRVGTDGFAQ